MINTVSYPSLTHHLWIIGNEQGSLFPAIVFCLFSLQFLDFWDSRTRVHDSGRCCIHCTLRRADSKNISCILVMLTLHTMYINMYHTIQIYTFGACSIPSISNCTKKKKYTAVTQVGDHNPTHTMFLLEDNYPSTFVSSSQKFTSTVKFHTWYYISCNQLK